MAKEEPTTPDACIYRMRYISPSNEEKEGSIAEVMDAAEKEKQEKTDSTGENDIEKWKEIERVVEEVELSDGTAVERIIRSRFEKPNTRQVELVFAEAQDGVNADDITTVV